MSEKKKKSPVDISADNAFMSFGRLVITCIMLVFMTILTMTSMLQTTGMMKVEADGALDTVLYRIREGWETIIYFSDSFIGNVLYLVLFAVICYLIMPCLKKIPLWAELAFVALWTIIWGFVWINASHSIPTEDSFWVTAAANDAAQDIFPLLEHRYFANYSFQLGYVFFNECLLRLRAIFGEFEYCPYLEKVNAILLAASYVGVILINSRVFKDQRVRHITAFLMLFAAQPIIFCTFTYGIIPGITFSIYAVLCMILYFQTDNFVYAILSAVSLGIAVMIKSNNNIVLVAVIAMTIVIMFKRKRFVKDIVYLALTCAIALSVPSAVKSSYEKRTGIDLGDPVPYSSWFLMGLYEAENGPGWYNPVYTLSIYEGHGFDAQATHEDVMGRLKERVKELADDPQYTNEFFYKKFISQWNETSYQSIWNNTIRANTAPREGIAEWVCDKHQNGVKQYMDYYAQLIFAAVLAGLFACLKNRNFLSISLPLIILGGMMYHLLAEAKSQYSLSYFILMIGFAGYGLCVSYDFFAKRSKGNIVLESIFRDPVPVYAVSAEESPAENKEEIAEKSPEENTEENAEEK